MLLKDMYGVKSNTAFLMKNYLKESPISSIVGIFLYVVFHI
jgi:hypothetical protein